MSVDSHAPHHEPARTIYALLAEPLGRGDAAMSHEAAPRAELDRRFYADVAEVLAEGARVGRLPRPATTEEIVAADIHASGCFNYRVEMAYALAARLDGDRP